MEPRRLFSRRSLIAGVGALVARIEWPGSTSRPRLAMLIAVVVSVLNCSRATDAEAPAGGQDNNSSKRATSYQPHSTVAAASVDGEDDHEEEGQGQVRLHEVRPPRADDEAWLNNMPNVPEEAFAN
jgi:hypothetical protein